MRAVHLLVANKMRAMGLGFALTILQLAVVGQIWAATAPDSSELAYRPPMHSLYVSLVGILDFTLLDSDKVRSQDLKSTEQHLKNMAEQAKAIYLLAAKSDKGREFLAKELVDNSELAYQKFKTGHQSQAKYFLSEVVSTCFGCHTSRSSTRDSDFTASLARDVDLSRFDPLAKARFLALSRQFESAEIEYEKVLLADVPNLDELINMDPMVEYLTLTLRVRTDFKRTMATLSKMASRNYPEVVKRDILSWIDALLSIEKQKVEGDQLASALLLIRQAKSKMEFPKDRSGIIHYIIASRMLEDYLKSKSLDNSSKAIAYYELGGCELFLNTNLSSESANAYFEESVKLVPKSDLAKKAFVRFEENMIYGYSGSSGLNLPLEEKKKIEKLKALAY